MKFVSNEKRISRATQTLHWSWTVDLVDKGIQCEFEKPTCNASNQTEPLKGPDDISCSDTTKELDSQDIEIEAWFNRIEI